MEFKRQAAKLMFSLWMGLIATAAPVAAVDVPNRNPALEERTMREARTALAASRWIEAVDLLLAHVKIYPDDADAHNLLGYSLRQSGRLADAQAAYERALQLDSSHRGAHEYIGELMLTLDLRERALFHLGELRRLCGTDCPEYQRLRRAIGGHKAVPHPYR